MEMLSWASIANSLMRFGSWLLSKCGRKLVELDDYKEEIVDVDLNYPAGSERCLEEKSQGAKFYWSEKYHPGYEKYFEIDGNIRRYFKCRSQLLWIKREK